MKKVLISLLFIAFILPCAFSFGFQADAFFGTSNGFDANIVFGSSSIKNSLGIMIDNHSTAAENTTFDSYGYSKKDFIKQNSTYFGPLYKLSYDNSFINLGPVALGIDVGVFASFGYDSVQLMNIAFGFTPAAKVTFKNFDFLLGYRGCAFLYETIEGIGGLKNSIFIGVRYNKSSNITQEIEDYPGYDHYPINIILPGSGLTNN